jgi:hypothetical protein
MEDDPSPTAALLDINMLVMVSGRERTPDEYRALFERAGLSMTGLTRTESPIAILEARAR